MDEGHFLQPGANESGVVRPSRCDSCAFRKNSPVHPPDFDRTEFLQFCADLDGFVCHTPDADGRHPECAGWAAFMADERA